MTQLPNRRHLESVFDAQFAMLSRSGVPFGALFMDIDHFKRFNDDHGHEVGDVTLQTVANTLAGSVRPYDTVGRWGGEEFVAIFPNTHPDLLTGTADKLCSLVRHSHVETEGGSLRVTISIGGTVAVETDTTDSLLKRADSLLYTSKESGRDRACVG
ncbi:MAG: GGDEF domain-containing protein [Planctomycetes bacterium]|nr:GGDEF domain-containing protein [Planctomycetota bacterium]